MEKAIFFESNGGYLHKCMFAGLDNEGNAQWVVVDQGVEPMTFSDYLQCNLLGADEMLLLCMGGERVDSRTMILLLQAVIRDYGADASALLQRIKTLHQWGISWNHEPLRMSVNVQEYRDKSNRVFYHLFIYMVNFGVVAEAEEFVSVDALMDFVTEYFSVVEFEAAIKVTSKRLDAKPEVRKAMRKEDLQMFDDVD
ncbi:MAG: hypothetical protein IKQ58_05785 [Prevotella sp.]|nr:hypothetical protein [Prevotella sp.]